MRDIGIPHKMWLADVPIQDKSFETGFRGLSSKADGTSVIAFSATSQ
jgi:hypothetical protein